MAVVALVGYSAMLVGAFGVRTVLHRRRTGISGWVAPTSTAARLGDALFTLGLGGLLVASTLDLAGGLDRIAVVDHVAVGVTGLVLLVVGAIGALTAQAQLGSAWRAGVEVTAGSALVDRGLFSIVRNPFYLGVLVASAGVALMVPTWVSAAAWLALFAGCEIEVRLVEEPLLQQMHGEAFASYTRSVPRFVPLPGRR